MTRFDSLWIGQVALAALMDATFAMAAEIGRAHV